MSERRPKIIRTGRGPVKSSRTPVASSHASVRLNMVDEHQIQGRRRPISAGEGHTDTKFGPEWKYQSFILVRE